MTQGGHTHVFLFKVVQAIVGQLEPSTVITLLFTTIFNQPSFALGIEERHCQAVLILGQLEGRRSDVCEKTLDKNQITEEWMDQL